MGISRTAFVGPYVACVPGKVEAVLLDRQEIAESLLGQSLRTPSGDYLHLWMDENKTDIYLANRKIPGLDRSTRINNDEVQVTSITPEMIAKEIEQFSDFFEKELFLLGQEYGEGNVTVQWGVIHQIS